MAGTIKPTQELLYDIYQISAGNGTSFVKDNNGKVYALRK